MEMYGAMHSTRTEMRVYHKNARSAFFIIGITTELCGFLR
jgi:hypothetical protein